MGRVTIVKASAGSGKTYQLSYQYVSRVIANPELYRSILAVTFTNKATEEMKRRIISEINDLANAKTPKGEQPAFLSALCAELDLSPQAVAQRAKRVRTKILHDYSHFTILTIDKFFQRIIRAFIRELGVESDFTLELQTDSVLAAAADRLIEESVNDAELRSWIVSFVEEQISDGKAWDIKREIIDLGSEIFKDHYRNSDSTVTKQEIEKIINSAHKSVQKIKDEMVGVASEAVATIDAHNLTVADFSYGKSGFANYFYKVASGDILGGYGVRVRDALESEDKWYTKTSKRKEDILEIIIELYPLLSKLTEIFDANISFLNTTTLLKENYRTFSLLKDLSLYVREICDSRNIMLISETNHIINRLIGSNDAPFIFEKVGNNFSHYMMDEFQDTSLTQWNNFYPLLKNALSQSDESPVLIVGDVKQSIYRWRGGDWEILGSRAGESFREIVEMTLDKNYRSTGIIVGFNNALIARCAEIDNDYLNDRHTDDNMKDLLKRAYSDSHQILAKTRLENDGYVKVITYARQEEAPHARYIIDSINSLQERGYKAKDIAIIVRYNAEAVAVANILLEYKSSGATSKYCYDVITSEALTISASPVVKFITACLRLATNIDDAISGALFRKHTTGEIRGELSHDDKKFLSSLRDVSLEEAFEKLMIKFSLDTIPGSVAYLQAYHDRLLSFTNTKISDIPLFLKWWDEKGASESINLPSGQDAITIITIHKSKGLQYPAVIMPYASWSIVPKVRSLLWVATDREPFASLGSMPVKFKNAIAESYFSAEYYKELVLCHIDNVNMLYVAVTRAERELLMIMPQAKRKDFGNINELIINSLDSMDMQVAETPEDIVYEYGSPTNYAQHSHETGEGVITANTYPTYNYNGKLRLSKANERYATDDENLQIISPRSYGRLMHKVFESIKRVDEITATLQSFETDGIISPTERKDIMQLIERSLSNPIISDWFTGDWDEIRNENDIIAPTGKTALRRPDRVLIKGKTVTIIDYKFGHKENPAYNSQIKSYMQLLCDMGYENVSGHIWYVEAEKVISFPKADAVS